MPATAGYFLTGGWLLWLPLQAVAVLPLVDVPLSLMPTIDPNIIVTLDDSGSMQSEIVPEGLIVEGARFVYPRAVGVYGGDDHANRVVDFDPDNWRAAMLRTSSINKIYYDPAVRYLPWSRADGTLMRDADTACAAHNPFNTGAGCRDLRADNTQHADWLDSGSSWQAESRIFFPAVYFQYHGGAINSADSYSRIEIKPARPYYDGGQGRTDCAMVPVCSYAEEIQNFANWYTYYRSRILLVRAVVGRVFAAQGGNMRVGFAAINQGSSNVDGLTTETLVAGVRQFSGAHRDAFYDMLYEHTISTLNSPLRQAMSNVGRYLMRADDQGPWSDTPGQSGGIQAACRQNYHILVTDGGWNGAAPAGIGNADNTAGPSHIHHRSHAAPATYRYEPALPYADDYSDTLADIAMHYWKNDLRPDLENKVPVNARNPAFWQHMVNFMIGVDVHGTRTGLPSGLESWPDPVPDDHYAEKIDDLWHAAVNSRGRFFSALDLISSIDRLHDALIPGVAGLDSGTAVTTNSSRVAGDAQVYQAKFNSLDWSGRLYAFTLAPDASPGAMRWEASAQLPGHASRSIYTHNGAQGLAFTAANFSRLSVQQQLALNTNMAGDNDGLGASRLNWLRGDQTAEVNRGGMLRQRDNGVLGAIVNSDLLYVQALDFGYDAFPADMPGRAAYPAYVHMNTSRTPVIYAGANDGMLHAFHAETGRELFAFVPESVYANLSRLTSPDYAYRPYVDGDAYAGDAYIGVPSGWKTILLGTLGGGGKSVFALDITTPESFSAASVLWEFSDPDLGYVHGQAKIALLNNGDWAAIIGNGYRSDSGRAYLLIVNLQTGELIKKIATDASIHNGLSSPALVDSSGDRRIDIVYAGDLQGNIWKFDLSHSDPARWGVAYQSGSSNHPLFTARNADNQVQPITSPLEIGFHSGGGYAIFFGTGQFLAAGDRSDTRVQSVYGIWDNGSRIPETDRSVLQAQTIVSETGASFAKRSVSNESVDWQTKRGWYIDLLAPSMVSPDGERAVMMPRLNHGRIVFATLIPSRDPCEAGGRHWVMLLDAETGGMLTTPQFDTNADGRFDSDDDRVAGMGSEGIRGQSVMMDAGGSIHILAATTSDGLENILIRNPAPWPRRSWKQIQ